ncbi:MAG: hypothetical protein O7E52_09645 [Candidatus Poribacteria bacterium]|nr:hypothetical protein [Candidatus Poribacteria bacterium]
MKGSVRTGQLQPLIFTIAGYSPDRRLGQLHMKGVKTMQPTKFQLSMLGLAVLLLVGFTVPSNAEIKTLQIHLFGFVNNDDARQIRRLLKPWANPEDVSFHAPVDKHGRVRHFTTVVEVIPRRGSNKYSESHTFDVYDIMRQLNDQRFRGSQIGGRAWVVKTEATVTGDLYAYPGWSRSYIRNVPFWRRWRANTSAVNHAMVAGRWDQKMVFRDSEKFDQLRQEAGQDNRAVEVKGQIVGFDGPYPVMSVRGFRVEYLVGPRLKNEAEQQETPASEEASEGTDE